jgi:hypothetical protein
MNGIPTWLFRIQIIICQYSVFVSNSRPFASCFSFWKNWYFFILRGLKRRAAESWNKPYWKCCLLICNAVYSDNNYPGFWRNLLPPSLLSFDEKWRQGNVPSVCKFLVKCAASCTGISIVHSDNHDNPKSDKTRTDCLNVLPTVHHTAAHV